MSRSPFLPTQQPSLSQAGEDQRGTILLESAVFLVPHLAWHAIMVPRSTQSICSPTFTPSPTTTTGVLSAPVAVVQLPLPSLAVQVIAKGTGGGEAMSTAWHAIMVPRSTQSICSPTFRPAPTTTSDFPSGPVAVVQVPLPSLAVQVISSASASVDTRHTRARAPPRVFPH